MFAVRIGLAAATVGNDAGQLLNMLFGNTSLHEDVVLHDVSLPHDAAVAFGGPRHGIAGLRARVGAPDRALTCSALKPQGLAPEQLGALAERFARGGIDYIKDDHGLADQAYSRFADRVRACAAGVARATRVTGHPTRYVPSLSGDLDAMRRQMTLARDLGIDCAHAGADDRRVRQHAGAGCGISRHGVLRTSQPGWRRAHRARAADRQTVPLWSAPTR